MFNNEIGIVKQQYKNPFKINAWNTKTSSAKVIIFAFMPWLHVK